MLSHRRIQYLICCILVCLFVCSNAGGAAVTEYVLQQWRNGTKREDIRLFEVEKILIKAAINSDTKGIYVGDCWTWGRGRGGRRLCYWGCEFGGHVLVHMVNIWTYLISCVCPCRSFAWYRLLCRKFCTNFSSKFFRVSCLQVPLTSTVLYHFQWPSS